MGNSSSNNALKSVPYGPTITYPDSADDSPSRSNSYVSSLIRQCFEASSCEKSSNNSQRVSKEEISPVDVLVLIYNLYQGKHNLPISIIVEIFELADYNAISTSTVIPRNSTRDLYNTVVCYPSQFFEVEYIQFCMDTKKVDNPATALPGFTMNYRHDEAIVSYYRSNRSRKQMVDSCGDKECTPFSNFSGYSPSAGAVDYLEDSGSDYPRKVSSNKNFFPEYNMETMDIYDLFGDASVWQEQEFKSITKKYNKTFYLPHDLNNKLNYVRQAHSSGFFGDDVCAVSEVSKEDTEAIAFRPYLLNNNITSSTIINNQIDSVVVQLKVRAQYPGWYTLIKHSTIKIVWKLKRIDKFLYAYSRFKENKDVSKRNSLCCVSGLNM